MQIVEKSVLGHNVLLVELDISDYNRTDWHQEVMHEICLKYRNTQRPRKPLVIANPFGRIISSEID